MIFVLVLFKILRTQHTDVAHSPKLSIQRNIFQPKNIDDTIYQVTVPVKYTVLILIPMKPGWMFRRGKNLHHVCAFLGIPCMPLGEATCGFCGSIYGSFQEFVRHVLTALDWTGRTDGKDLERVYENIASCDIDPRLRLNYLSI